MRQTRRHPIAMTMLSAGQIFKGHADFDELNEIAGRGFRNGMPADRR